MSVRIAKLILSGLSKGQLNIYMQKFGAPTASGLRQQATAVLAKAHANRPGVGGMAKQQARKARNPRFKSKQSEREHSLREKPPANTQVKRRKRKAKPQDEFYRKYRSGTRERDLE